MWYTVKYKDYPSAPKATAKSRFLGFFKTWVCALFTWIFFLHTIALIVGENDGNYVIAIIITSIFYAILYRLGTFKFIESYIDEQAALEMHENGSMTLNMPLQKTYKKL